MRAIGVLDSNCGIIDSYATTFIGDGPSLKAIGYCVKWLYFEDERRGSELKPAKDFSQVLAITALRFSSKQNFVC